MIRENNFTEGRILPKMVGFAVPVLFALILQATYGAVDMLIVGQFGGPADVSAVSTGSMVLHTVTTLIAGLAMGTTIILGQKIGEGNSGEAGAIIEGSIHLFSIIALAFTAIFVILAPQISQVLNAPEEAFEKTVSYVTICSSGMIFIVAYNILSSIMRGLGNAKMPLITVAIASVVNVLGDLLLVGVFGLAATGAAIATVAAQGVSVLISIIIIKKKGLPFRVRPKNIIKYKREIAAILKIGLPISLQG